MALITDNWKVDALCIIAGLVAVFYFYAKHTYSYWERKGIQTLPNANYFLGNFKAIFTQKQSFADFLVEVYEKTTEPFTGIYGTFRPMLFVRDPELIRTIMVKDFNNFTDRGVYCDEKKDPLSGHLFSLPGQKWRNLRGKLTPTFTSGKLKAMFSTLVGCGHSLQKYLEKAAKTDELVDIRDLAARYTTNNISSVAFGIEVDTIEDTENDFRKFGRKIVEPSLWNGIRGVISFTVPKLLPILHIPAVDRDVEEFINSVVKQNLEYREKNNISRKDFFQLLIQLRNNGTVQLDDEWETVIKSDETQKSMTLNEIAAQVFVFFVAGYETSSSTLAYCLYELAKQPALQDRVADEIGRVLEKHNGKITYESVSDMKLLDACIDETLRKYPIVPLLNRTCLNDYRIPGTKLIIEKGTEIFIPVFALHRDEKYYPDPMEFKPERFTEENSAKNLVDRPYMPFGDGPRNCIGMRLGKMQTKVGLVVMLQQFKYELEAGKLNTELSFDSNSILLSPIGGIHLYVAKR